VCLTFMARLTRVPEGFGIESEPPRRGRLGHSALTEAQHRSNYAKLLHQDVIARCDCRNEAVL
jgi:hypothetical protein